MTAATLTPVEQRARPADVRPRLGRLTVVELRKMVDTRAGFWVLLGTALLTAVVTAIAGAVLPEQERTLVRLLGLATLPAGLLMPVVGVLLVTSEWSQRTAMITFALVPQRGRVLVAKLLAALALSAVAFPVCLACGVVVTAVAGTGADGTWSLSAVLLGQAWFSVVTAVVTGVAFGAALRTTPPAIALFFLLPIAWNALGSITALSGLAGWLDQGRTLAPLLVEELDANQWARVGASLALWLVLVLVGAWRIRRTDVG